MSAMIVASYITSMPQEQIGESSRIFYYHIPQAWICVLAFAMSMVYSIMYLRKHDISFDDRAADAARLGFVFCLLATTTGSLFAKITWGSYWNWDPRQTSVFILLLIYGAYFALRGAIPDQQRRAALSAVYSIFAFVTVPFLVFVVPRIYWSLHPDTIINTRGANEFDSRYTQVLMASLVGFTCLYVWLYTIGCRIEEIRQRRRQEVL
jgi:heme exporter protein C